MHIYLNYFFAYFFTFVFLFVFQENSIFCCNHPIKHNLAIIKQPVVDLFNAIPENFDPQKVCASPGLAECPRGHQGILNQAICLLSKSEKQFAIYRC